jgi:hypothetical protein
MEMHNKKAVYTIIERNDRSDGEGRKSFWLRLGAAFLNRDGSYTVRLDALPLNGVLQLRDWPASNELRHRETSSPPPVAANRTTDIFASGS